MKGHEVVVKGTHVLLHNTVIGYVYDRSKLRVPSNGWACSTIASSMMHNAKSQKEAVDKCLSFYLSLEDVSAVYFIDRLDGRVTITGQGYKSLWIGKNIVASFTYTYNGLTYDAWVGMTDKGDMYVEADHVTIGYVVFDETTSKPEAIEADRGNRAYQYTRSTGSSLAELVKFLLEKHYAYQLAQPPITF